MLTRAKSALTAGLWKLWPAIAYPIYGWLWFWELLSRVWLPLGTPGAITLLVVTLIDQKYDKRTSG